MQQVRDIRRRGGGLPFIPSWPDEEHRDRMVNGALSKIPSAYAIRCALLAIAGVVVVLTLLESPWWSKALFSLAIIGGLYDALSTPPEDPEKEDPRIANWQ